MKTEVWDSLSLCSMATHPAARHIESDGVKTDVPLGLTFPGKTKFTEAKAFLAPVHFNSMKDWCFHSQEWRFLSQTTVLIFFLWWQPKLNASDESNRLPQCTWSILCGWKEHRKGLISSWVPRWCLCWWPRSHYFPFSLHGSKSFWPAVCPVTLLNLQQECWVELNEWSIVHLCSKHGSLSEGSGSDPTVPPSI